MGMDMLGGAVSVKGHRAEGLPEGELIPCGQAGNLIIIHTLTRVINAITNVTGLRHSGH